MRLDHGCVSRLDRLTRGESHIALPPGESHIALPPVKPGGSLSGL